MIARRLEGRSDFGGPKGVQLIQLRPFASASAALLLIAGAFCALLLSTGASKAQDSGSCNSPSEIAVLSTPAAPWKGAPLRVIFAAEKPSAGELSLIAPDGSVAAKSRDRHGGPPYFWYAEVASPAAGTWQARLERHGGDANCRTVTREIAVLGREPPRPGMAGGSIWPLRESWNRETENLYSAWIEKLFDAPLDAAPPGPRCMKCCATAPATSCTTI